MAEVPRSVDGLLDDDLQVFIEVLSRHGRAAVLRSDIETLVDGRFTTELLQEYDQHWGGSPDFNAESLVRLSQDGVSPELAGAALQRGLPTANDAIRQVGEFVEAAAHVGLSDRQGRALYQGGLPLSGLSGLAPEVLEDVAAVVGGTTLQTDDVLRVRTTLTPDLYAVHDLRRFLVAMQPESGGPGIDRMARALEEVVDTTGWTGGGLNLEALALVCSDRELSAEGELPLALLVRSAGPFHSGLQAGLVPTASNAMALRLAELARASWAFPAFTSPGILQQVAFQASAGDTESTPAFPDMGEAARRYEALSFVQTPESRVWAIRYMESPSALAAFEVLLRHRTGDWEYREATRAAAVAASAFKEFPVDQVVPAAELVSSWSRYGAKHAGRELRDYETELDMLVRVARAVADEGLQESTRWSEELAGTLGLPPELAVSAFLAARQASVPLEDVVGFLRVVPQVSARHVPFLLSRGVDPVVFAEVLRALPLEQVGVLEWVCSYLQESGVASEVVVQRIRACVDGNALPNVQAVILAGLGCVEVQSHRWGPPDLTAAMLSAQGLELEGQENELRALAASEVGGRGPALAWADLGSSQWVGSVSVWSREVACLEPWALYPFQESGQREALATVRDRLFPDGRAVLPGEVTPARDDMELRQAYSSWRSAWDARHNYADYMGSDSHLRPTIGGDDPRWGVARELLLRAELDGLEGVGEADGARVGGSEDAWRRASALVFPPRPGVRQVEVSSREELDLLAALASNFPEMPSGLAQSIVELSRHLDHVAGQEPAAGVELVLRAGKFQSELDSGLKRFARPLPSGTQLDARFVAEFAAANPEEGALVLLANFLMGYGAQDVPKAVRSLVRGDQLRELLSAGALLGQDSQGHSVRVAVNAGDDRWRRELLNDSRTIKDLVIRPKHVRHPAYWSGEALALVAPPGVVVSGRAAIGKEATGASPAVASVPEDSVAAHCARIGKVVDWYAGVLVDPLWVVEHAPALVDRRSAVFATLEAVLVRLQDHPLMQGSVDVSALEDVGAQLAPRDFSDLTRDLELAMHAAWDVARSSGGRYETRAVEVPAEVRLAEVGTRHEASKLRTDALGLLSTVEALRLEDPSSPEGAAKHAKADELQARAGELERVAAGKEAQASELVRDVAGIERLVRAVGSAPLLGASTGVDGLPALRALDAKERPALEAASRVSARRRVEQQRSEVSPELV